jgi:hypothetical protein
MDYKVLNSTHANKLKKKKNLGFILQIDFNLANVYLLSNWSYLVMPFNPSSDWLLTTDQELLHKWIKDGYFPMGDAIRGSYFERRRKLESHFNRKEALKQAFCDFIFQGEKRSVGDLSAEEINCLYEILRARNLFDRFRLNFILLLGDYIISRGKGLGLRWGLLNDKQHLNPIVHLVIVTGQKQQGYYNLEQQLSSEQVYAGADHYLNEVVFGSGSLAKNMVEIVRVFQVANSSAGRVSA